MRPFEPVRLRVEKMSSKANRALRAFDATIELDGELRDLISLRASFINGCAHCIDKDTKDAHKRGESEQRLDAVAAWEEVAIIAINACNRRAIATRIEPGRYEP